MTVIEYALTYAFVAVTVASVLTLWRMVKGPDVVDRILALDTLFINAIALLILFGMLLVTHIFFEAALLIAVVGFVSTVALCKFLLRGDVIE